MNTNLVLAACFVGAIIFSQPALANESYRTATVQVGDLNLESPQGRETLDLRIAAAARKVCSRVDHRRFDIVYRDCIRAAKASSVEQVKKVVINTKATNSAT